MLTKIIAEDQVQQAKHLFKKANKVAIVTHQSPDGDAVGSTLALADFLQQQEKLVQVIFPDPFPEFLEWMPGSKDALIYSMQPKACEAYLNNSDVIVCLDFNQLKRLGSMNAAVEDSTAKKIMIDHHPNPDTFADVTMSYPKVSSTSELIFRYICRSGSFDEMSRECAECVYTGMMTDTGAFTYNSNRAEIYFIVSELLEKGVDKDLIYNKVFNTWSADRMRLMGFLLNERMTLYPEYGVAILYLSLQDVKPFEYKSGDSEGFVNLPLSIKGIFVSVFVREDTDKVKLSFRSQGFFPVNEIAARLFKGGGHLNAAGAEFSGTLQEALQILSKALPTLGLEAYK
jgi:bifunctional oligoribonuclease and PAP phosphatase NrnA